jgi:hypothetical protein
MKTFNLIISFFYIISVLSQSSSPIFVNSYDVVAGTSGETTPRYLAFNTDGTKMFVVGGTNDRLLEYTLSPGYDLTTLTYAGNAERYNLHINNTQGDSQPRGIAFNNDGTEMFIVGNVAEEVNEYHLDIAFDISTASFHSLIDITDAGAINTNDLAFNADGTKMFITTNTTTKIFVFTLTIGLM